MSGYEWDEKRGHVELFYPNIYPHKGPLGRVTIGLTHVRAADSLTVEFDGARNGWVIRMDRKAEVDGMMETIVGDEEVAFVPAWNEGSREASE